MAAAANESERSRIVSAEVRAHVKDELDAATEVMSKLAMATEEAEAAAKTADARADLAEAKLRNAEFELAETRKDLARLMEATGPDRVRPERDGAALDPDTPPPNGRPASRGRRERRFVGGVLAGFSTRIAVFELLAELRGSIPTLQSRWREDEAYEDWEGVVIGWDGAEAGRVVELSLAECGIRRTLPSQVFELAALRELDVSGNGIVSLADDVVKLASLRVLNAEDNDLDGLPTCLVELTELKALRVERRVRQPPGVEKIVVGGGAHRGAQTARLRRDRVKSDGDVDYERATSSSPPFYNNSYMSRVRPPSSLSRLVRSRLWDQMATLTAAPFASEYPKVAMSLVMTLSATDAWPVDCTLVTSLPSPIAGNFGLLNSAGRPVAQLMNCCAMDADSGL